MGGISTKVPRERSFAESEKQMPVVLLTEQELTKLEHLADRTEHKNQNAQDLLDEWRVATVTSPLATGQSMSPEVLKRLTTEIRQLLDTDGER